MTTSHVPKSELPRVICGRSELPEKSGVKRFNRASQPAIGIELRFAALDDHFAIAAMKRTFLKVYTHPIGKMERTATPVGPCSSGLTGCSRRDSNCVQYGRALRPILDVTFIIGGTAVGSERNHE